ncbi:uncharacterized protein LOC119395912 [Rhipicephalus sanguineus]|uniref:uncharacterized protein LOC119395912 n=1 Tax=Rhipicephalus sanguineus TaxID=34632 RepID=UPI0018940E51|nr:uncharacterized protein LOC119395912 [Rhipicephalus sanguineus]
MQEKTDRICRNIDMWFDNIIRTVPEEVLNRPFRDVWDTSIPIPTSEVSLASASLATSAMSASATASSLPVTNSSLDEPSTSEKLPKGQVPANETKKKVGHHDCPISSKPLQVLHGGRMRTPLSQLRATGRAPLVRPKFDIREKPTSAREPRLGETLMSLQGSPVTSGRPQVHLLLNKDDEVTEVRAEDMNNPKVKRLCEAIEELCKTF